jgi:hypothetical protein
MFVTEFVIHLKLEGISFIEYIDKLSYICFRPNDQICECGLPQSGHKLRMQDSKNAWQLEINTVQRINSKYGSTIDEEWVR